MTEGESIGTRNCGALWVTGGTTTFTMGVGRRRLKIDREQDKAGAERQLWRLSNDQGKRRQLSLGVSSGEMARWVEFKTCFIVYLVFIFY